MPIDMETSAETLLSDYRKSVGALAARCDDTATHGDPNRLQRAVQRSEQSFASLVSQLTVDCGELMQVRSEAGGRAVQDKRVAGWHDVVGRAKRGRIDEAHALVELIGRNGPKDDMLMGLDYYVFGALTRACGANDIDLARYLVNKASDPAIEELWLTTLDGPKFATLPTRPGQGQTAADLNRLTWSCSEVGRLVGHSFKRRGFNLEPTVERTPRERYHQLLKGLGVGEATAVTLRSFDPDDVIDVIATADRWRDEAKRAGTPLSDRAIYLRFHQAGDRAMGTTDKQATARAQIANLLLVGSRTHAAEARLAF